MSITVRPPSVAGSFYPSSAEHLRRQLEALMPESEERTDLLGCIAPHAGYIYSGRVAGQLYATLRVPERVVVVGPNHTGLGAEVAISPADEWQTPLGRVAVDKELAVVLLEELGDAELDDHAHWREHSIEVQLPFLQARQPLLSVLPICVRHLSLEECLRVGEALAKAVQQVGVPVGLVASSDMTHYEPEKQARERDRKAIEAALTMNPERLYDTVHRQGITMCGVVPVTVVMAAAFRLGARSGELVAYETSGDTSGDHSAVVGYAGIRFSRVQ